MMENSHFRVRVNSGLKLGASHPIPLGELSIGTTLDSQFFIGCAEMWHQLLRTTASADLRSASASSDVAPEQMMRVVVTHDLNGLSLLVEQGFADIGQRRLLPGDSCVLKASTVVRMGASELEVLAEERTDTDAARSNTHIGSVTADRIQHQQTRVEHKAAHIALKLPRWLYGWTANLGLTAIAVAVLSLAMLSKPTAVAPAFAGPEPNAQSLVEPPVNQVYARDLTHDGHIHNERIVAVVSSEPAFLMTESGQRYDLGAVVDRGH